MDQLRGQVDVVKEVGLSVGLANPFETLHCCRGVSGGVYVRALYT